MERVHSVHYQPPFEIPDVFSENENESLTTELQAAEICCESKAPAKDPLQIPELLDLVLKSVKSGKDLKNCRLVSRLWNSISTEHMDSQEDVYVNLPTLERAQEFDRFTNDGVGDGSMHFPCLNFKMNASLLRHVGFREFFYNHSGSIKRLILTNLPIDLSGSHNITTLPINRFLFRNMPQVAYLEIHCETNIISPFPAPPPVSAPMMPFFWNNNVHGFVDVNNGDNGDDPDVSNTPTKFELNNLKVFKFPVPLGFRHYFSDFVRGVVESAPHLKELHVPLSFCRDVHIIKQLIVQGKTKAIKEIVFDGRFGENITLMEAFASGKPKVRVIHNISFTFVSNSQRRLWPRLENCFNKIFKSSSKTLVSLSMEPLGFLKGLKIPSKFPHLEQFFINVDNYNRLACTVPHERTVEVETKLFPSSVKSIQLELALPNVRELKITWDPFLHQSHTWETTFGGLNFALDAVCCLTLKCVPSRGQWLEKIDKHFPNVKKLRIETLHQSDNLQSFIRRIYSVFPDLVELSILEITDLRVWDKSYMDSCVTGIPDNICCELLSVINERNSRFVLPSLDELDLCPFPSLRRMKHLKTLTLTPCRSSYYRSRMLRNKQYILNTEESRREVFSPVASLYAFNHLPLLKLNAGLD